MKKTLIALATLAVTSTAFAQSSVTITGNVDAGVRTRDAQDNTADFTRAQINNTSTTALFFRGTEDLGGGLRANFLAEINWNPTQSQTVNGSAGSNYYVGTPFNGEQFLGLQGGFGNLRIGTPNSSMLETNLKAQPFGTAIGSAYMNAGIQRLGSTGLGINQFVGGVEAVGRVIRHERTVRYDTPTINGFAASYEWSGKNSNQTSAAFNDNNNGYSSLAVTYSNGPLNLAYSQAEAQAGANLAAGGTTAGAVVAGPLAANAKVNYQFVAANYKFGATTAFAGYTTGKSTGLATASTFDATSYNVGVRHDIGAISLMANMTRVNNKLGATDPVSNAIGANYALSKRTSAYFRHEAGDTDKSSAAAGKFTMTAVGIRHTF